MFFFRNEDYFEIPYRPPYEYISGSFFLCAAMFSLAAPIMFNMPTAPGDISGVISAAVGTYRMYQGYKLHASIKSLTSGGLQFVPEKDLVNIFQQAINEDKFWLGEGFFWDTDKVNKMHYIKNKGIDHIIENKKQEQSYNNAHWLHAIGKSEHVNIKPPLKVLNGMMVILGTTGAGKTRLYDVLISQAIQRGESVILIDPKGDKELPIIMKRAAERHGVGDKYLYFHPAKPEESVRLDVLKNWNRKTEIASRIRAILPTKEGDAFSEYAWQVINDIANAELLVGEKPNLFRIKGYVSGGINTLALRAIKFYCESKLARERIATYIKSSGGDEGRGKKTELDTYIDLYNNAIAASEKNPEVDAIIDLAKHDKDHLAKMIPILTPLLAKLTDGPLKDLLSPDDSDPYDVRRLADNKKIVSEAMILYMGLDSLSDSTIGSAIGSMELADLVAVAGDRYNYLKEDSYKPVNIYIDEAAEVINDSLIQLMNKGRGALFRVTLATQTISDLISRLGSKEKADMVLGNANSTIILRLKDFETAKKISESFEKIAITTLDSQIGIKSASDPVGEKQMSYGEKKSSTEGFVIPPGMFLRLPDLHFFASISGGAPIKGMIPIMVLDN